MGTIESFTAGRGLETGRDGSQKAGEGRGMCYSHANHPSSSSRRLGAGRGAPAPSVVGSRTYPRSPNGLRDLMEDSRPDCWFVLTGTSASRRDQPSEFMDSRKDDDAILCF